MAFVFDLDGILIGSVYQHVLAWREALEAEGVEAVRCVYPVRSRRTLILVQESAETVATFQRDRWRPVPRRR